VTRATSAKDSPAVLPELFAAYRSLPPTDRFAVDYILAEQVESTSESDRFDALAIVGEFRILSALPALKRLASRLENSDDPGAPYEWAKVNRLIAHLGPKQ
jgi:hypothetical protein